MLTNPGKVSKDFVSGKRQRYSNPFQFYLTVSILFFLIVGLTNTYQEFREFSDGGTQKPPPRMVKADNVKVLDSVAKTAQNNLKTTFQNLDSSKRAEVMELIPPQVLDSISMDQNKPVISEKGVVNADEIDDRLGKMMEFIGENPNMGVDEALDNLKLKKDFLNRFLYTRAEVLNSFRDNTTKANKEFLQELISYASVSLFIFLPLFTLFLKLIYIRRKFTYVEHLIFVFHTQTVFFILSTIFFIISQFVVNTDVMLTFTGLFLIYLYIAMKKFYQQGYFRTFFKFMLLNTIYTFLGALGSAIVIVIAFALY